MFWVGFAAGAVAMLVGIFLLLLVLYAIGQASAEESAELGPEKR